MNVNDRNQGTKKTMRTPIVEPKRGGARTGTPRIPIFENIFDTDDRCPRRGAVAGGTGMKKLLVNVRFFFLSRPLKTWLHLKLSKYP